MSPPNGRGYSNCLGRAPLLPRIPRLCPWTGSDMARCRAHPAWDRGDFHPPVVWLLEQLEVWTNIFVTSYRWGSRECRNVLVAAVSRHGTVLRGAPVMSRALLVEGAPVGMASRLTQLRVVCSSWGHLGKDVV